MSDELKKVYLVYLVSLVCLVGLVEDGGEWERF